MANVRFANKDVVCTATNCSRMWVRSLVLGENHVKRRLHVPIFQRRYCWPENVVVGLYQDLLRLARGVLANGPVVGGANPNAGHSINRVIISRVEKNHQASGDAEAVVVIDGQQRQVVRVLWCLALLAVLCFPR